MVKMFLNSFRDAASSLLDGFTSLGSETVSSKLYSWHGSEVTTKYHQIVSFVAPFLTRCKHLEIKRNI